MAELVGGLACGEARVVHERRDGVELGGHGHAERFVGVRGVQLDQVLGEVVRGADRAEGVDSGDVSDDLASRHYVDVLLPALLSRVDDGDLRDQLREALAETVDRLGLTPGAAPSSTVLILRVGEELVEAAALGDSTAVIGHPDGTTSRLSDDRLARIGADQRRAYREHLRLAMGSPGLCSPPTEPRSTSTGSVADGMSLQARATNSSPVPQQRAAVGDRGGCGRHRPASLQAPRRQDHRRLATRTVTRRLRLRLGVRAGDVG
ncbi:hypothetical protein [Pseudonocardia sp.]|uniref:hypothetical protein n=1 Tax=Pseudonocardia sp. TaxID=60912 RepID=UPI0031FD021F